MKVEEYLNLPYMAGYILTKAEIFLKIGYEKFRKGYPAGFPSYELDSNILRKIHSGFEQLIEHKGFFPDQPVKNIGTEAFHAMMRILCFHCMDVGSKFKHKRILDEMVFANDFTETRITLYNEVAVPKKTGL
jgi:hypothetical protein